MSRPRIVLLAILGFVFVVASANTSPVSLKAVPAASNGAWTVYHRDNGHTGNDTTLPMVTSVSAGWTSPVMDQQVYAEPLIYNGIVYAATLNNTVYAFRQSDGGLVWSTHLRAPETGGWPCGNVSTQGILSTPVVDPGTGRIYVADLGSDDIYRVDGLDLATGTPQMSTVITTMAATGFDWTIQQNRGALAVANGNVYVPIGGRWGDCGNYHGWVFGVPTNGAPVTNYYVTPGSGAGFWSPGGVVIDDTTGNVFVTSGNGAGSVGCNANADGTPTYENDAVVRLSPTLAHQDSFIPPDWQANWCLNDMDLGSASPLLISPNLMFQSGKWGTGFLLNPANLGGMGGQRFPTPKPATYVEAPVCLGNNSDATFGSFAYAAPYIYLECHGHGLVGLNTDTGTPSFNVCDATCASPNLHMGGTTTFGPPIVAAGAVWAVSMSGGGLYAFNATTGAQIYHSASFPANNFVTPAEAGGQVFVPSGTVIRSFTMSFLTWTSLGGVLTSGPDASSWGASHTDVFVRGLDSQLYHNWFNGTSWQGFQPLGGSLNSDPSAVSWGPNRIDVFSRGPDNQLWHTWWDGAKWNSWQPLGGSMASGPDASSWAPNRLDVFYRGNDNQLWHTWWDGAQWNAAQPLGGVLTSDPTAISWGPNRVDIFARFTDNQLWHTWWDGVKWNSWQPLGGLLIGGPDAASCASGHLDVFALGGDSALYQLGWNGSAWLPWKRLGGQWTSDPGVVCPPATSSVYLSERGTDNALWQSTVAGT